MDEEIIDYETVSNDYVDDFVVESCEHVEDTY